MYRNQPSNRIIPLLSHDEEATIKTANDVNIYMLGSNVDQMYTEYNTFLQRMEKWCQFETIVNIKNIIAPDEIEIVFE